MKKMLLSSLLLLMTGSALAQPPRRCRVWRTRHHHRVCVRWDRRR